MHTMNILFKENYQNLKI